MQKILVISHDKVGPKMAGPGIRYHQIATELAKHYEVTLATFNPEHLKELSDVPYSFRDIKSYQFQNDFDEFDVIIAMWLSEDMINYAKQKSICLIFDLYAPVPVEDLVSKIFAERVSKEEDYNYAVSLEHYKTILRNGDLFLCSNEIQKDFWIGFAFSAGAVGPSNYKSFPLFDRVQTLPMGINMDELKDKHNLKILSERIPQIKETDWVIVWTGGIWDWFDAITPIDAVSELVKRGYKDIKFVFLGTRHPNSDVPDMDETSRAFEHAKKLGLYNSNVFFLEGWLDYSQRLSYLLRADIALYAHKPSIEARYSHRTRVLDHILASLPTIATAGDYFAEEIETKKLGVTVSPTNKLAMADAIELLHKDKGLMGTFQENIRAQQDQYTWTAQMHSLVEFLEQDPGSRERYTVPSTKILGNGNKKTAKIRQKIPRPIKDFIKRHMPH